MIIIFSRFDKSTESVLNGRNAAMFINIECKKRGWDMEFEEVDQIGPVHDRTYTYSLTIGAQNSEVRSRNVLIIMFDTN